MGSLIARNAAWGIWGGEIAASSGQQDSVKSFGYTIGPINEEGAPDLERGCLHLGYSGIENAEPFLTPFRKLIQAVEQGDVHLLVGTEGQDRESYTDDQDRDSYVVEEKGND